MYSAANKQKLVTRSSTECELVGMYDVLPQVMWTKHFLCAQGYPVKTRVNQDNTSTMLLAKNGRSSSTKRTKHIELRYFFIHEKVKNGEIEIEHCPTTEMRADFFSKPLQGKLFYKQRDHIMNIDPSSEYHSNNRSVLVSVADGTADESESQTDGAAGADGDVVEADIISKRSY